MMRIQKWRTARTAARLLAAGALFGACQQNGSFVLSWRFSDQPETAMFNARQCGLHGVESFKITGVNDAGNHDSYRVLCGPGSATLDAAVGHWRLTVEGLDSAGHGRRPDEDPSILNGATVDFDVKESGTPPQIKVVIVPRDSCKDGVDNDSDGAVDRDDSDCMGDGASELKSLMP